MLKNIFLKTLFEKRLTLAFLSGFTFVIVFLIVLIFPSIKDMMAGITSNPQMSEGALAGWFGPGTDWTSVPGYIAMEIFGEFAMIPAMIMAFMGASLLAGDESKNILQPLILQPVSRAKVYLQKFAGLVVILTVIMVAYILGVIVGILSINETVPFGAIFSGSLMVALFSLSLGAISLAIGAISGKNVAVAGMMMTYAFMGYMLANLTGISKAVDKVSDFMLYKYVDASSVVNDGLNWGHIGIFAITTVVALGLGLAVFQKRDITFK